MQLPSIGVAQEFISFKNCSMESEKYICIRETGAQNQVVIVDMAAPMTPARRQITADSALMCLDKKVIALKASTPGTPGKHQIVFTCLQDTIMFVLQYSLLNLNCRSVAAAETAV